MSGDVRCRAGSVVQIEPSASRPWGGCLLIVTGVYAWGVQGYIPVPARGDHPAHQAFWRGPWYEVRYVGEAPWPAPSTTVEAASTVVDGR